jgi:putative transposase
MARPLRIEFPGALYHVTARGDRRERIYADAFDCHAWLDVLSFVCARHRFLVHAYCLMPNHYHLLLETVEANLSSGMQLMNSMYSQAFNRRHRLVGHLFQGRYKAIVCEKKSYLKELARYIVLNPVRAKLATDVDAWEWSSQGMVMGRLPAPVWFDSTYLLSHFGQDKQAALEAYMAFVRAGLEAKRPLDQVEHQTVLGHLDLLETEDSLDAILRKGVLSRTHRKALIKPLETFFSNGADRDHAIAAAYATNGYTMGEIARHCGVSTKTVSRAVQRLTLEKSSAETRFPG